MSRGLNNKSWLWWEKRHQASIPVSNEFQSKQQLRTSTNTTTTTTTTAMEPRWRRWYTDSLQAGWFGVCIPEGMQVILLIYTPVQIGPEVPSLDKAAGV